MLFFRLARVSISLVIRTGRYVVRFGVSFGRRVRGIRLWIGCVGLEKCGNRGTFITEVGVIKWVMVLFFIIENIGVMILGRLSSFSVFRL